MVSLVNSQGTWTPATSRHKNKIEKPGLVQQEQIKNRKHTEFYAPIGFAFFAFVVSCFGSFGPTAVRCISLWLILNCGNMSLFLLVRVFHQWIPLPVLSSVLSAIARHLLVSVMLSPRLL